MQNSNSVNVEKLHTWGFSSSFGIELYVYDNRFFQSFVNFSKVVSFDEFCMISASTISKADSNTTVLSSLKHTVT